MFLARGQQFFTPGAHHSQGRHLADRLEEIIQLLGGSENFAAVHSLDTFAEKLKRGIGQAEESASAGAEGLHSELRALGFHQTDFGNSRMRQVMCAQRGQIREARVRVHTRDDGHADGAALHKFQNGTNFARTAHHFEAVVLQRAGKQLALHGL